MSQSPIPKDEAASQESDLPETKDSTVSKKPATSTPAVKGPSTPKAKAPAKASAKASAKVPAPKASGQGTAVKKHQLKGGGSPTSPKSKPKPKSAPKSKPKVKDLKQKFKDGVEGMFGSGELEEPGDEGAQGRDRCKKQKFDSLLAKGQIPSHIADMFAATRTGPNPRKAQTEIINTLFQRSDDGRLVMQAHAPLFQAYKDTQEQHSFKDKHTALPRSVFCGQFFANNEEALMKAINLGEVQVYNNGSVQFCAFQSLEVTDKKSKISTQRIVQVDKKIEKTHAKDLATAFDEIKWTLGKIAAPSSLPGASAGSSPSGVGCQLALQDVPSGIHYICSYVFQALFQVLLVLVVGWLCRVSLQVNLTKGEASLLKIYLFMQFAPYQAMMCFRRWSHCFKKLSRQETDSPRKC